MKSQTKIKITFLFFFILTVYCCEKSTLAEINFETEKAEILHTINSETAAAFNRNYELWKSYWVQKAYVTKTYINFSDSTSTETLGWEKVDDFVRVYIEEHPEPEPLPKSITDIEVRLYNSGAFVNYEVNDIGKRKKRETRLMEKENGQWKIAGMHTSIY